MINMKDKQMEILLCEFQLLSKTVLTQLAMTSKLMDNPGLREFYDEIEANEIIIDRLEVKIREEVVFSIFKFNPVATDLRLIIAYQDLTANLERVGDILINIIHRLRDCQDRGDVQKDILLSLRKIMEKASDMIKESIFAFSNKDREMAQEVIKKDDEVDMLFHQLAVSLQKKYAEKQLTREEVAFIIDAGLISYNLERIGDSATNIAEATIFITDGKDIRHGKKINKENSSC